MKILILQLARLGDIYLSWPVVRALKRMEPDGEIHMLVRPRFQAACEGLESVDKIHLFPTEKFVAPLIQENFSMSESLNSLDQFLDTLAAEKYDRIINLSFSTVSSYITSFLATPETQVSGYTRHSDGYMHLSDDVSRYFWAQVGTGLPNRLHVMDLLGGVAGVDFRPHDFRLPTVSLEKPIEGSYFVAHIGASEKHKQVPLDLWSALMLEYQKINPQMKWVLIGSQSESDMARHLISMTSDVGIINKTGQTNLGELFGYLQFSCGLLGGDSGPMHMVPFVDQKAFCISAGNVKFWETGPITLGSCVYLLDQHTTGSYLASLVHEWSLEDVQTSDARLYHTVEEVPRYRCSTKRERKDFSWGLVQAIYMGASFPVTSDLSFYKACVRMFEANQVAIENLRKRDQLKAEMLTSILSRVDEIFLAIIQQEAGLTPLFRWYQAEKTRILPGTFELIAQDTLIIHEVFHSLLKKYLLEEDVRRVEANGSL